MNICIIGIVNEYFRKGLESILKYSISQVLPNESIHIYKVCKPACDVVFIDIDNLSNSVAIAKIKSIRSGVMIFIISTRVSKFNYVNISLSRKGFFIQKRERVSVLENLIKSKFQSMLNYMEKYDGISADFIRNDLTPCQNIIIGLIHSGLSGREISSILNKSEKTISAHKRSAMKRLGINTNHELYELGLFDRVSGSFN